MNMLHFGIIAVVIAFTNCHELPDTQGHAANADAGGAHDSNFDHQQFLGSEQAAEFDTLPAAESKKRLEKMLHKIDKDNNTVITQEELKVHIEHMAHKYVYDDIKRTWAYHPVENDKLEWVKYKRSVSGHEDEEKMMPEYREVIAKDSKRWPAADLNKDGHLDFEEYRCFQHPEDCQHMRQTMVEESMGNYDKDKDGFVDFQEFIHDVYYPTDEERQAAKEGREPEWMKGERDTFNNYRDKNGDGKLDMEEVGQWMWPQDYDHSGVESHHLVAMADDDKDGQLSFKEILNHYDVFVGSQATHYGEQLKKRDPAEL